MLVILGDTSDPSGLFPLIKPPPMRFPSSPGEEEPAKPEPPPQTQTVSLLIHEATGCFIPPDVDLHMTTGRNRSFEFVEAKAKEKGHSTPGMAGAFARLIG